jgi:hypothetical protein
MNKLFLSVCTAIAIGFASCSSDDSTQDTTETPDTPAKNDTIAITAANVRDYIVDANATDETVALFYNLKKLSANSFAVGQQDAFSSFYKSDNSMSRRQRAVILLCWDQTSCLLQINRMMELQATGFTNKSRPLLPM